MTTSISVTEFKKMLKKNPSLKVNTPGGKQRSLRPAASELIESTGKEPNQTEAEYRLHLAVEFLGCEIIFEGIRLRLRNGEIYTPDWVVITKTGRLLLVECKNAGYKHASYGRSKMAYKQCIIDWPMFEYRWAEKVGKVWVLKKWTVSRGDR